MTGAAKALVEGVQIVHTPDAEKEWELSPTPGGDPQLDVRWAAPVVVDGEIVMHPPHRSPLDADEDGHYPTSLRGGVITDPAEIERIRARIEHAALPAWRRAITRNPEGWR